jgi:hypothetical protein
MSTYRDRTGSEVATRDNKPIPLPLPCTFCGSSTPHATLVKYGARCVGCFEAYCLKGFHGAEPGFLDGRRDSGAQAKIRDGMRADRPVMGKVA